MLERLVYKPCIVIPVYNHEHAIGGVLAGLLPHGLHCILVDDGSSPACAAVLRALAQRHDEHLTLVTHEVNQGKGGAVMSGFRRAAQLGFSHALQVDADGQHNLDDVARFLEQGRQHPDTLIVGCPIYDDSVPKGRLYGRYATHVWVWINTLSLDIRDSMCGFRVYPLAPVLALLERRALGRRMNFDIEILVRLYWDGVPVLNLPTRVAYPADGVSHFQAWRDNVLISRLHATLFFGMLPRAPRLLARKWLRP
ncbi:glycosyltransferase family 2 protein [Massilia sp. erpn]|uniref:glycosyltransferase family 2 protein n=1 Tax=Massilia sp. erpn TaxID=2738142 RepID=UPI00210502E1|nr:glycosyltransferase family 2 protein [Massilia sp. erpn]UTY60794.1 glycosyltransferase family 2 protein [Massilia sp. erpn]